MKKCPRCELNYMKENQKYCDICNKELYGKEDNSELDMCIICGSNSVTEGENVCVSCLKKVVLNQDKQVNKDEYDESFDSYHDLSDTEIPECELDEIDEPLDEYDESDDYEE